MTYQKQETKMLKSFFIRKYRNIEQDDIWDAFPLLFLFFEMMRPPPPRPQLFNLYINDMITKLKDLIWGTKVSWR